MRKKQKIFLIVVAFGLSACGSMGHKLKAMLGGKSTNPVEAKLRSASSNSKAVRFSEKSNLAPPIKRRYRRMTKGRFEAEGRVEDNSGSLWVMEGQGAYLFSQNQVRMVGDLLNVRIVGSAREQLETKSNVIEKLLKKLERPETSIFARKKSKRKQKTSAGKGKDAGEEVSENESEKQASVPKRSPAGKTAFSVELVPTRITEKLPDGSYRVRGVQAFMIGKREYKTIVTGIIRSEDFNDAGVDSGKILEAKYDIVSNRRSLM